MTSFGVNASDVFYCFSNGKKSILLVSIDYPKIKNIKYYPYMKNISLSEPFGIEEVDMGDNAKPEIYRSMHEILNGKITGKYSFMSQGYLLYDVTYTNKKTGEITYFEKQDMTLKDITCI